MGVGEGDRYLEKNQQSENPVWEDRFKITKIYNVLLVKKNNKKQTPEKPNKPKHLF